MCDGTAVSRTTFADLFAVIGTTFGVGNGSTTFNVPNLAGRFPLGAGGTPGLSLAASGGAWDHTHTGPSHTHTGPSHVHDTQGATVNVTGGGQRKYVHDNASGELHGHADTVAAGTGATGSAGTGATGSANAPHLAVNYIIRSAL